MLEKILCSLALSLAQISCLPTITFFCMFPPLIGSKGCKNDQVACNLVCLFLVFNVRDLCALQVILVY